MLTLILAACFPVVVFLVIIYKRDTVKEPPKQLIKCFVWGCISTVPIIVVELVLSEFNVFDSAFGASFYDAFVVAALVEEGFKFMFLYWLIWRHREFDQYYDGIVYAVFVSLGFALIENIFYVIANGFGTAVLRALLSVPAHGFFGVIMGYFFAIAKFNPQKKSRFLWLSLLIPILFHGLYDFPLFYFGLSENLTAGLLLFGGFLALMIILWRLGIKYIKSHFLLDAQSNMPLPNYPPNYSSNYPPPPPNYPPNYPPPSYPPPPPNYPPNYPPPPPPNYRPNYPPSPNDPNYPPPTGR